jgi:DNA repair protein REV1
MDDDEYDRAGESGDEHDDEGARGGSGGGGDDDDEPRLAAAAAAAAAGGAPPGPSGKRPREPTMHWAEEGFRGYIETKVRKLEEQHRSNQALQPALSATFRGVSIHVNGLTDPSHAVSRLVVVVVVGRKKGWLEGA